jgi:hypothetical protein
MHRPRISLTIRQKTQVLQRWPRDKQAGAIAAMIASRTTTRHSCRAAGTYLKIFAPSRIWPVAGSGWALGHGIKF